jgi:hypothetical protein
MKIESERSSFDDLIDEVNLSEVEKSAAKAEFRKAELIRDMFLRILVPAGAITLIAWAAVHLV